jgi:hypothetical protein
MPAARRAGQDDRGASYSAAASSCAVLHAARTAGTCTPPGMPGIQASSNPVTAPASRLRIQGEVLTSRSADAGWHPEHSPPADPGTPQRRATTPQMSRTSSTRLPIR